MPKHTRTYANSHTCTQTLCIHDRFNSIWSIINFNPTKIRHETTGMRSSLLPRNQYPLQMEACSQVCILLLLLVGTIYLLQVKMFVTLQEKIDKNKTNHSHRFFFVSIVELSLIEMVFSIEHAHAMRTKKKSISSTSFFYYLPICTLNARQVK